MTMITWVNLLLLPCALAMAASITVAFVVEPRVGVRSMSSSSGVTKQQRRPRTATSFIVQFSQQQAEQEEEEGNTTNNDKLLSSTSIPAPASSTTGPVSFAPARRPLDPLVARLTSMDDITRNAPTIQIPIWGDLILDQSLFVFVPVATFALLGIVSSLFVLANSGDAFVQAMADQAASSSSVMPQPSSSDSGCRGLCSSQEQDLEGMKAWMNAITGKKL